MLAKKECALILATSIARPVCLMTIHEQIARMSMAMMEPVIRLATHQLAAIRISL